MNAGERLTGGRAVVAARSHDEEPDTNEIRRLAEAAGYEVVGEVTQRRIEDTTYDLGRGKAEDLSRTAAERDADAVVFDGHLAPGQYASLLELLPRETTLVDRYRLVLDIFAEGAGSRAATLQVELATLRYELPRLREATEESLLNRATEKGSPVLDVEGRIDHLESALADLRDEAADRRERRRAEGFDYVALAGYTNAGKSTLLHRLADDLAVEDAEPEHGDLSGTAEIADRLFETLETTTRRATLSGRRVLFTDTVGLVSDLPHELVRSFSTTLGAIEAADVVLAVIDTSADPERLHRRASVTMDALAGETDAVIPVLNKADRLEEATLAERLNLVRELAGDAVEPVATSALYGDGADELRAAVVDALPGDSASFVLPNAGETQSLLAWLHERGRVDASYRGDVVEVSFAGKPSVVAEAERRAEELASGGE